MIQLETITPAQLAKPTSLVYFVQIGKYIKIGFTTNLKQRMSSFQTSSADVDLLLAIPGDRALEQTIHNLLDDCRIEREHFRREYRTLGFISNFEYGGLDRALSFLKATTPRAIAKQNAEDFRRRVASARQSRAEKNAYFASLVAERKSRLGW